MKRLLFVALSVLALCILAQSARLQAQGKPKEMNAYGTVKSVSANSLAIAAAGGKEMSFTIDSSTKFIGKGLSTKTARLGKLTAPDAVAMNDRVTVRYTEMSGAMHAVNVRVTNKAIVAKK